MLTRLFNALCRLSPALKRWMWRRWYQFLAGRYDSRTWSFMNYGYAPLDPDTEKLALEANDEPDRYCIQLYHHVASAINLEDKEVLEVGSGRGGGSCYIKRYLKPRRMVGVDFSANVVAFCKDAYSVEGLSYMTGDAEQLPFEDESFDAVVNVESSHCYGSIEAFLAQVRRVLRPGGYFLFADLRSRDEFPGLREQLKRSGMEIVTETDIAANVLRALELDDARKKTLIRQSIGKLWSGTFAAFAGVKGSGIYEDFRSGAEVYHSYVLRKPEVEGRED